MAVQLLSLPRPGESLAEMSVSPGLAVAWGLFIGVSFVASFFFLRVPPAASRDDPTVIMARIKAVSASIVISLVLTYLLLNYLGVEDPAALMGFRWTGLGLALVLPIPLFMCFFLGSFVLAYFELELPGQMYFNFSRDVVAPLSEPSGWRNWIFAPFAEELAFRSCIFPLMFLSGFRSPWIHLLVSLYFGVAHLNHLRDIRARNIAAKHPRPTVAALVVVLVQLVYTSIFGTLAAYIYYRTGHILAAIMSHVVCNVMGFPSFGQIQNHPKQAWLIWASFALGIGIFCLLLGPLTDPVLFGNGVFFHLA
ncbi:hypothetical protein H696_02082 [Fonticula alba]|uniref:intramembrane prenyl-peptidase Rce1 n=1 Tax=Fonticula alba TaxID=691883 RepID=A0A058ZB22_FONAL|nr:hypothetical protein H696_02082 [Fonticula alba]KCV71131.1 hypothetical protein H696_02082 [Fonticula alba]|eukprot:XP_009494254.1 hypothetical protein H696_02082 [Fonticula alba]